MAVSEPRGPAEPLSAPGQHPPADRSPADRPLPHGAQPGANRRPDLRPDRRPDQRAAVEVSVVLAVKDAALELPVMLACLARQDYQGTWEVLVVDNGSTDGTGEVARSFTHQLPHLQVLQLQWFTAITAHQI